MVEYEKAIKRPFQDIKKLLIGAILNIIPIVNLIASGYIIKAAKGTMNKKNDLPEWEDWGNLFVTGLIVAVIGFIYSLPAVVLLVVGIGSAAIGAIGVGGAATTDMTAVLAGGGIMILVGLLLLLVAMLVMPMAIIRYVDKGNFSAAFGLGDILRKVFTGKYYCSMDCCACLFYSGFWNRCLYTCCRSCNWRLYYRGNFNDCVC